MTADLARNDDTPHGVCDTALAVAAGSSEGRTWITELQVSGAESQREDMGWCPDQAGRSGSPRRPVYRAASYGVALPDLTANAGGLRGPAAVVDAVAGRRESGH
jgi:hypothetical protein